MNMITIYFCIDFNFWDMILKKLDNNGPLNVENICVQECVPLTVS